jgi:hypothetical protein
LNGQEENNGKADFKEIMSLNNFFKMNVQILEHQSLIKENHEEKLQNLSSGLKD